MRFLSLTSILLLILTIIPVSLPEIAHHSCAPLIPPAVPGTLVQPPATRGTLFINEAMLNPHSIWNCSELQTYTPANDAWIEIFNPQNQPFDLYSVHTNIDSGPNTNPFYLPLGSAIAPHSFLVVFPRTGPSFLATETQTLRLLIGATPIDEVTVPAISEDYSYARIPDGSTNWEITSMPTIDASNTLTVVSPTPTRTKAEATATARALARHRRGSNSNRDKAGGDGGNGSRTDSNGDSTDIPGRQQQVDGVQPTWSSLKHPDGVTITPTMQSSNTAPLAIHSGDLDVPRKILLTVLVAGLAGVLFWCWRLFRPS